MRSRAATGATALALACAGACAGSAAATFPGADGRLAFFAGFGCGRYADDGDPCIAQSFSAIMTVAPAGGRPGTLARCPGAQCIGVIGRHPVWSPDGTRLAVGIRSVEATASPEIAILSADGALVRRVAVPRRSDATPVAWLPDGRRVAGIANDRVFTVAAAGGPARAVAGLRGSRAWSVRGDVAITNGRGIYVWRTATGRRRLIRRAGTRYRYGSPDWSPDGRRLAVERTEAKTGLSTIVIVPARGGRSRVVVRGPSTDCLIGDPVWSPHGTRLAFASTCLDETGPDAPWIYAVRPDGTRLRRLFDPSSLVRRLGLVDAYVSSALSWQARP
jgi:Tol biopolymer transport system component